MRERRFGILVCQVWSVFVFCKPLFASTAMSLLGLGTHALFRSWLLSRYKPPHFLHSLDSNWKSISNPCMHQNCPLDFDFVQMGFRAAYSDTRRRCPPGSCATSRC